MHDLKLRRGAKQNENKIFTTMATYYASVVEESLFDVVNTEVVDVELMPIEDDDGANILWRQIEELQLKLDEKDAKIEELSYN